jgi:hypothetical protein
MQSEYYLYTSQDITWSMFPLSVHILLVFVYKNWKKYFFNLKSRVYKMLTF